MNLRFVLKKRRGQEDKDAPRTINAHRIDLTLRGTTC